MPGKIGLGLSSPRAISGARPIGTDLELVTHQGKLQVKCQRKAPEEGKQFRFNTRRYGEFERVISLPDTIDTDAIQAELRDGVLYVTLNKPAEAQPKWINVGG